MQGHIVEINTSGSSLHLYRGFLSVKERGEEIGRVPIDDVDAVLSCVPGVMWSSNAIAALALRGAPVVALGEKYLPSTIILPLAGHHDQGRRMRAQADLSIVVRKQLWASVVKQKIQAQNAALQYFGHNTTRLERLVKEVKSGDKSNREAVAAQYYWPVMMGEGFRRDRNASGTNALLNYGYTVLRAATARGIVASGLHPSLSLHHVSNGSSLCLADDLMEPFRPTIDIAVRAIVESGEDLGSVEARRQVISALQADFKTSKGRTPLSLVLVRLAQSMANVALKEAEKLDFPCQPIPLTE